MYKMMSLLAERINALDSQQDAASDSDEGELSGPDSDYDVNDHDEDPLDRLSCLLRQGGRPAASTDGPSGNNFKFSWSTEVTQLSAK